MKPAPFLFQQPGSLESALSLLADHGENAKLLAGGQSLVPMLNLRIARTECILDINRVPGLDHIRRVGPWLEVGALVRHHDLACSPIVREELPLLAQIAATVGHYPIRQRGTLGGSLAHADPAAQLPLAAVLFEAEIVIRSQREERILTADEFFLSVMTTALEADEMITSVRFPLLEKGESWGFRLFRHRVGDFALAIAAVVVAVDDRGLARRLRLAVGGVGPVPVVLPSVGEMAVDRGADEAWCVSVAAAAAESCAAEESPRVPATYRRDLVQTLAERALRDALDNRVRT